MLEAVREVLQDVYDVPALVGLLQRVQRREVQLVDVTTSRAVAVRPVADVRLRRGVHVRGRLPDRRAPGRRAQPRPGLLAELLGRAELRELLDPEVLAEVEAELQRTAEDRRARDAEGVVDLLRMSGR